VVEAGGGWAGVCVGKREGGGHEINREGGQGKRTQRLPSVARSRTLLHSISPPPPPPRVPFDPCPPTPAVLRPSYEILDAVKDKFGESHVYRTAKM